MQNISNVNYLFTDSRQVFFTNGASKGCSGNLGENQGICDLFCNVFEKMFLFCQINKLHQVLQLQFSK